MTAAPKTIRVAPDSEPALLVRQAAADAEPVLVDTGDEVFAVRVRTCAADEPSVVSHVPDRDPSPEEVARSIEEMRKAAGSRQDIDAEAFKAYIWERRRTASRLSAPWSADVASATTNNLV